MKKIMQKTLIFLVLFLFAIISKAQQGYYEYRSEFADKVEALVHVEEFSNDTLLLMSNFLYYNTRGQQVFGIGFRKISPDGELYQESHFMMDSISPRVEYFIPSVDTSYFMVYSSTRLYLDTGYNHYKDYLGVYKVGRNLKLLGMDTLYIPGVVYNQQTGRVVDENTFVGSSYNSFVGMYFPIEENIIFTVSSQPKITHFHRFPPVRYDSAIVDIFPSPIHDGYIAWGGKAPLLVDTALNILRRAPELFNLRVSSGLGHIVKLPSGKYISLGNASIFDGYDPKLPVSFLHRLSEKLVVEQTKIFDYIPSPGRSIDALYEDKICVSDRGRTYYQINNELEFNWEFNFHHLDSTVAHIWDVKALKDSGCLYSGIRRDISVRGQKAFFVRVNKEGEITSTFEQPLAPNILSLYPNPAASGDMYITLSEEMPSSARIYLYDMSGHPCFNGEVHRGENVFHLQPLPSGMYIYVIKDKSGKHLQQGKWSRL